MQNASMNACGMAGDEFIAHLVQYDLLHMFRAEYILILKQVRRRRIAYMICFMRLKPYWPDPWLHAYCIPDKQVLL